ncbi:MAG: trans-aconitate 2-methyltransferase [Gaiellaceae bacterium]
MTAEKYGPQAERWTEDAYADAARYLEHRAELIVSLGPPLEAGDRVLDLACGDGGLAEPLLARGLAYAGVDLSEEMVAAARRRLADRAPVALADLNDYAPPEPVAATTCFRAIYYARDRLALFRHVATYTERKLVFDLNPRQYRLEDVRADLRRAGFGRLDPRPFLVPQTKALPRPVASALELAERSGPLARALLRMRFTYVCAASRG